MISFNVSPKMRSSDYKYAMVYQVDHKRETKITQLTVDISYTKIWNKSNILLPIFVTTTGLDFPAATLCNKWTIGSMNLKILLPHA